MSDLPMAETDLRCALLLVRTSLQTLADAARSDARSVLALVDDAILRAKADSDAVMIGLLQDVRARVVTAPQLN